MNRYGKVCAIAALMGFSGYAAAASFQIQEQNAKDLGTAYAGAGSLAEDSSSNFYNPAALTEVTGYNAAVSAVALKPSFKIDVTSARDNAGGAVPGAPGTVKSSGTPVVPGLHMSSQFDDKFTFGLSVVTPYGLKSDYPNNDIQRYAATKTKMQTIDITPSVAYKVNDKLSIAGALDFMQSKLWLDSVGGVIAGGAAPDANVSIYGKDNSMSFRLGVFYKLSDRTQMGLSYNHQHSLHVKGTINAPLQGVLAAAAATNKEAKASARLPASLRYSVTHKYDDKWTMLGDLQWTKWSVLREIRIAYTRDNNTSASEALALNYKNAWRLALGAHYKHDDMWTFKGGLSYDMAPTNNEYRGIRIPDSNRWWLSLGAKYKFNEAFTLDAGYTHIFFKKTTVRTEPANVNAKQLIGTSKASANLVGVQLTWNLV